MNIKKRISTLLIAALLVTSALPAVTAARSLTLTNQDLQRFNPLYILITIGNQQGCEDVDECPSHNYEGTIIVENADLTLFKEVLIQSDELLDNDLHDTGMRSSSMEYKFSTPFYKGMIIKLFPYETATIEDTLTLTVTKDDNEQDTFVIPFEYLSVDSTSVLATGSRVDADLYDWIVDADWIRVSPLFAGLDKEVFASNMRNKLQVFKYILGLERYTREALLAGKIENLTYLELQQVVRRVTNNIIFTNNNVVQFKARYERLKRMLNTDKTSLPRLIGGLKVMLTMMRRNYDNSFKN